MDEQKEEESERARETRGEGVRVLFRRGLYLDAQKRRRRVGALQSGTLAFVGSKERQNV